MTMQNRPALGKILTATSLATMAALATPVQAQDATRDRSIDNLPRPGYEPRRILLGATVIEPEIDIDATYDDNIYATSSNADDDFIFRLAPSVRATRETGKIRIQADAYASLLRYVDHKSENTESFGVGTELGYIGDPKHGANLSLRYDRSFERRTDPESNPDISIKPTDIDIFTADYTYRYMPGRIGIGAAAGVTKINYLSALDSDRDLTTYRASVRAIYQMSSRLDLFLEGYGNLRDARLEFDRNGIDRDTRTIGASIGGRVEIADRLQGELGAGYFRANPADPRTPNFSGISANGRITWRPRIRTAVSLDVFRGNVATVRSGASGRIDTRIGVRVDQEVRHNLIMRAGVSMRDTSYRGSPRDQTQWGGEVGGELLLNRYSAVTFSARYMKRTAEQVLDEFDKFQGSVGVRLRF